MPKKKKTKPEEILKEQAAEQAVPVAGLPLTLRKTTEEVKAIANDENEHVQQAKHIAALHDDPGWQLMVKHIQNVLNRLDDYADEALNRRHIDLEEVGLRTLVKSLVGHHLRALTNRVENYHKLNNANKLEKYLGKDEGLPD